MKFKMYFVVLFLTSFTPSNSKSVSSFAHNINHPHRLNIPKYLDNHVLEYPIRARSSQVRFSPSNIDYINDAATNENLHYDVEHRSDNMNAFSHIGNYEYSTLDKPPTKTNIISGNEETIDQLLNHINYLQQLIKSKENLQLQRNQFVDHNPNVFKFVEENNDSFQTEFDRIQPTPSKLSQFDVNLFEDSQDVVNQFKSELSQWSLDSELDKLLENAITDLGVHSQPDYLKVQQDDRRYSNFLNEEYQPIFNYPLEKNVTPVVPTEKSEIQKLRDMINKINEQQKEILNSQRVKPQSLPSSSFIPNIPTKDTIPNVSQNNLVTKLNENSPKNTENNTRVQIAEMLNKLLMKRNENNNNFIHSTESSLNLNTRPSALLPTRVLQSDHQLNNHTTTPSNSYLQLVQLLRQNSNSETATRLGTTVFDVTRITSERTVSSTSIKECLKTTLCGLAIAAVVAASTTGAIAVPILAPVFGFMGKRRRRNLDYLVLTRDNSSSFINNYMKFLEGSNLNNISAEESIIFGQFDNDRNETIKNEYLNVLKFLTEHKTDFQNFPSLGYNQSSLKFMPENMTISPKVAILPIEQTPEIVSTNTEFPYIFKDKDIIDDPLMRQISRRNAYITGPPIITGTQIKVFEKKENLNTDKFFNKSSSVEKQEFSDSQNYQNSQTLLSNQETFSSNSSSFSDQRIETNSVPNVKIANNKPTISQSLFQTQLSLPDLYRLGIINNNLHTHQLPITLFRPNNRNINYESNTYENSQRQQINNSSQSFSSSSVLENNKNLFVNDQIRNSDSYQDEIKKYLSSLIEATATSTTTPAPVYTVNTKVIKSTLPLSVQPTQSYLSNFMRYYKQIQEIENLRKKYIERILTDYLAHQMNKKISSPPLTSSNPADVAVPVDLSTRYSPAYNLKQGNNKHPLPPTRTKPLRPIMERPRVRPPAPPPANILQLLKTTQQRKEEKIKSDIQQTESNKDKNSEVKYFYKVLCKAIVGPDIPLNKVTSYIAEKCIVMKYIGLI